MRVLKRPLTGVYLLFFLMVTLLHSRRRHVDGAVPRQADHAARADAGGRRARNRRRPSRPARRAAEQRRVRLARRGVQLDGRRTGHQPAHGRAIDVRARTQARRGRDPAPLHRDDSRAHHDRRGVGRRRRHGDDDQQRRVAAAQPRPRASSASRRPRCSIAQDLQPLGALLSGAGRSRRSRPRRKSRFRATARNCIWPWSTTALVGDTGAPEGLLLVLDDVTPLIRAQKVAAWREVARRLAHEIKNPLTPIQLSAERLRRHFAGSPPARASSSTSARRRSSAKSSRSRAWSTSSRSSRGCRRRAPCRPISRSSSPTR